MPYQTEDTQPERTSLAWSRSSLALFVGTIWVCRDAFVGRSAVALTVLILSLGLLSANYLLLRGRQRRLRNGVESATGTGLSYLLLVLQILALSGAALLQ